MSEEGLLILCSWCPRQRNLFDIQKLFKKIGLSSLAVTWLDFQRSFNLNKKDYRLTFNNAWRLQWGPTFVIILSFFLKQNSGFNLVKPMRKIWIKNTQRGLPWWRSGWESACQCRGHGFEPGSGKIPHAAEQLGPWATITEPARLEPVLHNKRGRDSERPAHRDEEWPPLAATGESPRTETKTQHS